MRFIHLSDLHIGKKLCEISMVDEQRGIFSSILDFIPKNRIDAVIIAGDIYDKSVPPVDAVLLFDEFLQALSELEVPVLMISGNHDSAERLSFGAGIMKRSRIFIGTSVEGALTPVTMNDEYGPVNFYLLPFLRPSDVNNAFSQSLSGFTEAVGYMIESMGIDLSQRNVILSHQYVAGASLSESETIIGGTECVDRSVYEVFDYTALGHLHTPQNVGSDTIRYCGTPLKYSLSEVKQPKSITIVELGKKGNVSVSTSPLTPLHDMKKLRGTFNELIAPGRTDDSYIYAELTDENDVPFAAAGLRSLYPNLVSISYSPRGESEAADYRALWDRQEEKNPSEIFEDLFRQQHGDNEMTPMQLSLLREAIDKVWR